MRWRLRLFDAAGDDGHGDDVTRQRRFAGATSRREDWLSMLLLSLLRAHDAAGARATAATGDFGQLLAFHRSMPARQARPFEAASKRLCQFR